MSHQRACGCCPRRWSPLQTSTIASLRRTVEASAASSPSRVATSMSMSPSCRPCSSCVAVSSTTRTVIPGYCPQNAWTAAAMKVDASSGVAPMRTLPRRIALTSRRSDLMRSRSPSRHTSDRSSSSPSLVSSSRRVVRSSSRSPSSDSRFLMSEDSADWVMNICSAAWVKLPACATATKARICFREMLQWSGFMGSGAFAVPGAGRAPAGARWFPGFSNTPLAGAEVFSVSSTEEDHEDCLFEALVPERPGVGRAGRRRRNSGPRAGAGGLSEQAGAAGVALSRRRRHRHLRPRHWPRAVRTVGPAGAGDQQARRRLADRSCRHAVASRPPCRRS